MRSEKTLNRIISRELAEVAHDVGFELPRNDISKLRAFRREAFRLKNNLGLTEYQQGYLMGLLDLIEAYETAVID